MIIHQPEELDGGELRVRVTEVRGWVSSTKIWEVLNDRFGLSGTDYSLVNASKVFVDRLIAAPEHILFLVPKRK